MGAINLNAMNEQCEAQAVQGEALSPLEQEYNKIWGGGNIVKPKVGEEIQQIELSRIVPFRNKKGKKQPFKLNKEKVAQIKASAKDIGIITPIIVRPWTNPETGSDCYQILSGHHRFKVAQELAYATISCIVRNVADDDCDKYVVEANIQRVRLLPTEYGEIFNRYMEMRGDLDMTANEIAEKFGVSPKSLYRYMNVVKCSDDIQNLIDNDVVSPDCSDILCSLDSDKQAEVVAYVVEKKKLNLNGLKKFLDGESDKPKEVKYTNKKYKDYSKRYGFTIENFSEEELDTVVDLALEQYFTEHGFTEKKEAPTSDTADNGGKGTI